MNLQLVLLHSRLRRFLSIDPERIRRMEDCHRRRRLEDRNLPDKGRRGSYSGGHRGQLSRSADCILQCCWGCRNELHFGCSLYRCPFQMQWLHKSRSLLMRNMAVEERCEIHTTMSSLAINSSWSFVLSSDFIPA
jgi:hypothetical protein